MKFEAVTYKSTKASKRFRQKIELTLQNVNFRRDFENVKKIPFKKRLVAIDALLEKYDLSNPEFRGWLMATSTSSVSSDILTKFSGENCYLTDVKDIMNESYSDKERLHKEFPFELRFSADTSQRDLIDFIKSRWNIIKHIRKSYEKKRARLRTRTKIDRDDFIWENRDESVTDILDLVEKKFPKESLDYNNINTILSAEKKRRSKK